MAHITARETGITINLDFSSQKEFVCFTGEGVFPPISEYSRFTFIPKKRSSGVIAFRYDHTGEGQFDYWDYNFFQYYWSGDKVFCEEGLNRNVRPFSESKEFGLMVQVSGITYITRCPEGKEIDAKLVDLKVMLEYIEGKIGPKELVTNASSCERRQVYIKCFNVLEGSFSLLIKEKECLEDELRLEKICSDNARSETKKIKSAVMDFFNQSRWLTWTVNHLPKKLQEKYFSKFLVLKGLPV